MSALPKAREFLRSPKPFAVKPWSVSSVHDAPEEAPSPKNPLSSHKSKLGIPPVLPVMHTPAKDWRMVDARHISGHMQRRTPSRVAVSTVSQSLLNAPLLHRVINRFIDNWIIQEFWFAMNKLSIVGLVTGLMFLGAIFFGVGFLTAYQTIPSSTVTAEPMAWEKGIQRYGPAAPPYTAQPSNVHGGVASGLASGVVGNQMHNFITAHTGKISGAVGAVQSKIPAPFQPFVNYGANRVNQNMVMQTHQATQFSTDQTKHLFSPQGLSHPQSSFAPSYNAPLPPAQGPLPGIPQAYAGHPQAPTHAPTGYNSQSQLYAAPVGGHPMMHSDQRSAQQYPTNNPYPPVVHVQPPMAQAPQSPMGPRPVYPMR